MNHKSLTTLCLALLLMGGCKGDPGPAGPLLYGTLQGYAILYTEEGLRLPNHSGVLVTLESTNFSATTNSSGHWIITNVPTGIYSIQYKKPGYFDERTDEFQFLGGGNITAWLMNMAQLPTFTVSNFSVTSYASTQTIVIRGNVSDSSSHGRYILIFMGRTSNVSFADGSYVLGETAQAWRDSISFERIVTMDSTQRAYYGLVQGEVLYAKAYPGAGQGPFFQYWPKIDKSLPRHFGTSGSLVDTLIVP